MKHLLIPFISFCIFTLAACTKQETILTTNESKPDVQNLKASFTKKDFKLKNIKLYPPSPYENRVEDYDFSYNKNGGIERISYRRTDQTINGESSYGYNYQYHYKGSKLDSVNLILTDYNNITSMVIKDIVYSGNKITGYNMHLWPYTPENHPDIIPWKQSFDKKGRLMGYGFESFLYDGDDFIVSSTNTMGSDLNATYTYDRTANPLFIENVYLGLDETMIRDQSFCKWNLISKISVDYPPVLYTNRYDNIGRLTERTFIFWSKQYRMIYYYYE
jgi:hypothetical protein